MATQTVECSRCLRTRTVDSFRVGDLHTDEPCVRYAPGMAPAIHDWGVVAR